MTTKVAPTLDDLYHVPEHGKAELVNGDIVVMSPTGGLPGYAASEIFASLRDYVRQTKYGHAVGDNVGFAVDLPHRKSFSPDAAFYIGPVTMKFLNGAPQFAAEVRSENDYGEAMEQELAQKRADYFAAGTLVVWDVDLLGYDVIRVYRVDNPSHPTIYHHGEDAEAEPAVPGWTLSVDSLFI